MGIVQDAPFWVYVLELAEPDSYYVGQSGQPHKRLMTHTRGKVAATVGYKRTLCLLPAESRGEALILEGSLCREIAERGFNVNQQSIADLSGILTYLYYLDD